MPGPIFVNKVRSQQGQEPIQVEHLSVSFLLGKLLALLTSIWLIWEKHSSLAIKLVNCDRKKDYDVDTCGQCHKTFYGHKLRLFIIS